MTKIGIIDYRISNLSSVTNALEYLEIDCAIAEPGTLNNCTHAILPGVGSFARGMENIHQLGLAEEIRSFAASGRPVLGICLGMQLLAEAGDEFGPNDGLGLIPGRVSRIPTPAGVKLPHVGWNTLTRFVAGPLWNKLEEPTFYFVHSYAYDQAGEPYAVGHTEYGGEVIAAVGNGKVYGVQFHPEKSQADGLQLLRNFAAL